MSVFLCQGMRGHPMQRMALPSSQSCCHFKNLKLGLFYMQERWDCWVSWLGKGLFKRNNTELIVCKILFDKWMQNWCELQSNVCVTWMHNQHFIQVALDIDVFWLPVFMLVCTNVLYVNMYVCNVYVYVYMCFMFMCVWMISLSMNERELELRGKAHMGKKKKKKKHICFFISVCVCVCKFLIMMRGLWLTVACHVTMNCFACLIKVVTPLEDFLCSVTLTLTLTLDLL